MQERERQRRWEAMDTNKPSFAWHVPGACARSAGATGRWRQTDGFKGLDLPDAEVSWLMTQGRSGIGSGGGKKQQAKSRCGCSLRFEERPADRSIEMGRRFDLRITGEKALTYFTRPAENCRTKRALIKLSTRFEVILKKNQITPSRGWTGVVRGRIMAGGRENFWKQDPPCNPFE